MALWGLGPVFVFECVSAARRWQTYAVRSACLALLLLSLTFVWATQFAGSSSSLNLSQLARVGELFFYAIAGTQLALVLLAAPAYTAGAVCLEKARGTLTHLLVTNLSAADIILGKLGSRLMPVLGLVLANLPILTLATLLGGIDPEALLGSFLVTVGIGMLSCSLALALSVWGNKPYEVLLGTYAVWVVLLLAWPIGTVLSGWGLGSVPEWLEMTNPFWLSFAPYLRPQSVTFHDVLLFLGGCFVFTVLLTLMATLTLRRVANPTIRARRARRSLLRRRRFFLSLDFNPVLWREWHRRRPSRWVTLIWALYVLLGLGASFVALTSSGSGLAAFVNAFLFSIGLLLVSVTSVTSLFEERVRGSLDLLLATPLSTSSIVWGKWMGTYRTALRLTVLPIFLVCSFPLRPASLWGGVTTRVVYFPLENLGVLIGLMLAYGAAVTSLGLALATWVRRFGVAVGLSVAAYVLIAGGPIMILLAAGPGSYRTAEGLAIASPWFGVGQLTFEIGSFQLGRSETCEFKMVWIVIYSLIALVLMAVTQATFNRCLGRIGRLPQGKLVRQLPRLLQSPPSRPGQGRK